MKDMLTVLTSTSGAAATKRHTWDPVGGCVKTESYGKGYLFAVDQAEISSIYDLKECIIQMQPLTEAFFIRAEPVDGIDMTSARRIIYDDAKAGDKANFKPAARHWFCVDFDGIAPPDTVDVIDDPEGAVEWLVGLLPAEFHDATCVWQFSSSQGIKTGTVSCHVFFYSDIPLSDADLDGWAKGINKEYFRDNETDLVDASVYRAVQPIYVAAPLFEGLPDPLPRRVGLRKGLFDNVSVVMLAVDAELPFHPTTPCDSADAVGSGFSIQERLDAIGGPGGFKGPILQALSSYIATNGTEGLDYFKRQVRAAICNANPGGRDDAQIDRYISDKFLDDMISWICARESTKPAKTTTTAVPKATFAFNLTQTSPAPAPADDTPVGEDCAANHAESDDPAATHALAASNVIAMPVPSTVEQGRFDRETGAFVPTSAVALAEQETDEAVLDENQDQANETNWRDFLPVNDRNRVIFNADAASLFMQYEPRLKDCFAYDEFRQIKMLTQPVPLSGEGRRGFKGRELRDSDIFRAVAYLNRIGLRDATKSIVADAIDAACDTSRFSPVRNELEELPAWDGTPRLDKWLSTYLSVQVETDEHRVYVEAVGRRWLISSVARTLQPGCQADGVLILEGDQGAGKSTALSVLCGQDFFGDNLPPMKSKDASDYVRGKRVIELSELVNVKKDDVEIVKNFLSCRHDRFRPAYGRSEIIYPRQCVFAGTTNKSDYLRDETGNRRFWPVRVVGMCDIKKLKEDRDQIWAEALAAYKASEKWHLEGDVDALAREQQDLRFAQDPWEAEISAYLDGLTEVSVTAIAKDKLKIEVHAIDRRMQNRISSILGTLGWRRVGKFTSGPDKDRAKFVPATQVRQDA